MLQGIFEGLEVSKSGAAVMGGFVGEGLVDAGEFLGGAGDGPRQTGEGEASLAGDGVQVRILFFRIHSVKCIWTVLCVFCHDADLGGASCQNVVVGGQARFGSCSAVV